MDIITHAIAGAVSGQSFGHPILGAVVAVVPDLTLGWRRRVEPPVIYRMMHSLLFLLAVWLVLIPASRGIQMTATLAVFSHLYLDLPTHGPRWAPRLFYPLSNRFVVIGDEWEWGNESWFVGFAYALIWIILWTIL